MPLAFIGTSESADAVASDDTSTGGDALSFLYLAPWRLAGSSSCSSCSAPFASARSLRSSCCAVSSRSWDARVGGSARGDGRRLGIPSRWPCASHERIGARAVGGWSASQSPTPSILRSRTMPRKPSRKPQASKVAEEPAWSDPSLREPRYSQSLERGLAPQAQPPADPEAVPPPGAPPAATPFNWILVLSLSGSTVLAAGLVVALLLALGVLHT